MDHNFIEEELSISRQLRDMKKQFFTVEDIKKLFQVSDRTVRRWIKEEFKLGASKVCGKWVVPLNSLEKFVQERNSLN